MRVALRTTPLFVIGLALIGCGKAPTANYPSRPHPRTERPGMEADTSWLVYLPPQPRAEKPRTEAASNLPMVELRIPRMF